MTVINAPAEVKALKVTSGEYTHAFMLAPAGKVNWYFANLGLIAILQHLNSQEKQDYVRNYMDLYISKLSPTFTSQDVVFTNGDPALPTLVKADSDDSYASTFLSLASRYLQLTQDWQWWEDNKATLKNIAYYNLVTQIKPNGLTRTFQAPDPWDVGYLMDNCESYRGLKDLCTVLSLRGDSDFSYYNSFTAPIATAMLALWDSVRGGFKASDAHSAAETSFYPGLTCQLFPQAFGVSEMSSRFSLAWSYFALYAPKWQTNVYDPFPWQITAYVGALRGYRRMARTKQTAMESLFATNRAMVTINELGWYQRTKNVLNGLPPI